MFTLVLGGMAASAVLGAFGYWLIAGGAKAKNWFLAWDPTMGGAGAARLIRFKPGQRTVTTRTPDGKRMTFPLKLGYGITLYQGDKVVGSLFIGDTRAAVPVSLKAGQEEERREEEIGELVVLKPVTETIHPNAEELSAALEDVREIKMARAQRQVNKGGGIPTWVLAAGAAVLLWVFFF